MLAAERGFTLMEVLISGAIASVTLGGTLMVYQTAAMIRKSGEGPVVGEAAACAQELLEQLRNEVSADTDPTNATAAIDAGEWFDAKDGAGFLADRGNCAKAALSRQYEVIRRANCDGATSPCYEVTVKVSWSPGA